MIQISLQEEVAPRVRPLHGVNLAAPIFNAKLSQKVSEHLRRLHVPLTRLHDAPLDNPGLRLVDVPCVFPNPHADPDDLRNYYFDQTDDYIQNAHDYGTRIMYRLGVSIEHSAKHYWTKPPADLDRWCRICLRIVEHYPDIEYWEIGNECDEEIPLLWDGTWPQFIALYVQTAKYIKARFPRLKVGGPSMARLNNHDGKYVRDFLDGCRDAKAPLDFFSWHQYSDKPEKIIAAPAEAKALLQEYGFAQTELHIAEWHYHPGWGSACTAERQQRVLREMLGVDAAAYLGAVLTGWQDTPLTMGHYYTGSILPGYSGYAIFEEGGIPSLGYHVMEQFCRLTQLEQGLKLATSDASTWALGASTANRLLIMLSSFKTPQHDLTLDVGKRELNPSTSRITIVDQLGGPHVVDQDVRWEKNQVTFEKTSGSAVVFYELETR
jgi:hypothetical protein